MIARDNVIHAKSVCVCYSNSKRIQVFSGFSERIHIVLEEADETIFKQVNIYFLMLNF